MPLLTERYDLLRLRELLGPHADWRPFPPASDRAAWSDLARYDINIRRREAVFELADAMLREPWPNLAASLYMRYRRDGDRSAFEEAYFGRRARLAVYVLRECMIYDGCFIDAVIDALWSISEEATWCLPAHAEYDDNDPLPRAGRWTVDLFACETAATLAEAVYLLHDELRAVSPSLVDRIHAAVRERVLDPVMTRDDIGWFSGFNNWTPWCASNTLAAAMYAVPEHDYLTRLTYRLMTVVDRFIDRYPPDGGCDEGASYWNVAAGALTVFLELLHGRSGGEINIYDEPLLYAMGQYIVTMHLDGPWFAGFADGSPRVRLRRGVACRLGERTGNGRLRNLALLAAHGWDPMGERTAGLGHTEGFHKLSSMLHELFWLPWNRLPEEPRFEPSAWLPDTQVLVARQSTAHGEGLIVAAKGGRNDESHNHNDIGEFIVLLDGCPCVIDIGTGVYTSKSFSSERYDIWYVRGSGHDVPVVNGIEQAAGGRYRACGVDFQDTGDRAVLSMHLENAYPEETGIGELVRELVLDRTGDGSVTVRDTWSMSRGEATVAVSLFTPRRVSLPSSGLVLLETGRRPLRIEYDLGMLEATVERIDLDDAKLRNSWGECLHRVRLTTRTAEANAAYALRFSPG